MVRDGSLAYKGAIPDYSLGEYGGTLRLARFPAGGIDVFTLFDVREPLIKGPDISLEGAYGNVLESFEVSPDNKEFTFTLRKGMKWSDGTPVTMDDVKFTFEDLYMNEEYQATVPSWMRSTDETGTPAVFEVIDDWTFKLTYTAPGGSLVMDLALGGRGGSWPEYDQFLRPKHYLQQWHPKYADAGALKAMLDKEGIEADRWATLFNQKYCNHWNMSFIHDRCVGFPNLSPYVMTEVTVEAGSFERNPYYWKVDEAGRQLPYIDKLVVITLPDAPSAQVLALSGGLDMLYGVDLLKAALFMETGNKLGFELILTLGSHADAIGFFFNGCTKDPVLSKLFNDIRFRKALNYAMNRQEINDSLYLGFAEMPTSIMESEYSPDKANALLDEIGMTQRDADGYRLSPDGKPVKILVEGRAGGGLYGQEKGGELFCEHLKAVGINAEPRMTDLAVLDERGLAKETQINVWETYNATDADGLFTSRPYSFEWCYEWNWVESSGDPKPEGMPDEFVSYMQAIVDRIQYVPRSPDDAKLYDTIKTFYKDHYWVLISATKQPVPIWVNGKIGNIVHEGTGVGLLDALAIGIL